MNGERPVATFTPLPLPLPLPPPLPPERKKGEAFWSWEMTGSLGASAGGGGEGGGGGERGGGMFQLLPHSTGGLDLLKFIYAVVH